MSLISSFSPTLLVMAGGALGAALRYHLGRLLTLGDGSWPLGTFAVNIIGGFSMGILMAFLMRTDAQGVSQWESYRLFIGVGLLGGFTTFSAFSLEMAMMIERGDWMFALMYSATSVLAALLALFAGMAIIRMAL